LVTAQQINHSVAFLQKTKVTLSSINILVKYLMTINVRDSGKTKTKYGGQRG